MPQPPSLYGSTAAVIELTVTHLRCDVFEVTHTSLGMTIAAVLSVGLSYHHHHHHHVDAMA
jgi:hypothetical protein